MKKIFILLLCLLSIMSCSKKPGSQKTFENFMLALQTGDIKKMTLNNQFDESFFKEFPIYLEQFKMIKYEILEVKERKNTATIKILIEAPNLIEYFPEVVMKLRISKITSRETGRKYFDNYFLEILKRDDLEYKKNEVTLNMVKRHGKWGIDQNNPDFTKFILSITGGMNDSIVTN